MSPLVPAKPAAELGAQAEFFFRQLSCGLAKLTVAYGSI